MTLTSALLFGILQITNCTITRGNSSLKHACNGNKSCELRTCLVMPDVDRKASELDGALQGSLRTAMHKPRNSEERNRETVGEPKSGFFCTDDVQAPRPTNSQRARSSHSQTKRCPASRNCRQGRQAEMISQESTGGACFSARCQYASQSHQFFVVIEELRG